ncbi:MAG: NYN domain-containing protein [Deltaproteobacteria bacterium]|nr:NYN domain-containing protein [Deltaproteobacteria bacterium]
MNRVIFFVDGFNLYHAIAEKKQWRKYKWLNLHSLCKSFLSSKERLDKIFFFTAFYPGDEQKRNRHRHYVRALKFFGVIPIFGQFRRKDKHCKLCKEVSTGYEEKETDVNIAIELLRQAVYDNYDTAFILSGDSDLLPAIRAVTEMFPNKTIKLLLPPGRRAELLKQEVHMYMKIKDKHLRKNQFNDPLESDGVILNKPKTW